MTILTWRQFWFGYNRIQKIQGNETRHFQRYEKTTFSDGYLGILIRWRTQQNVIIRVNCKVLWIIETLNAFVLVGLNNLPVYLFERRLQYILPKGKNLTVKNHGKGNFLIHRLNIWQFHLIIIKVIFNCERENLPRYLIEQVLTISFPTSNQIRHTRWI